jgi:hypothetical protein
MNPISATIDKVDQQTGRGMAAIPMPQNPGVPGPEPIDGPDSSAPGTRRTNWWDDITRSRFSAWRVPVGERLQWLQAEIDSREDPPPPGVLESMRIAHRSTSARSSLANWYSGADIERAWRALHHAEARLHATAPDLGGRLPALRERACEDLDPKDQRLKALVAVTPAKIGPDERAAVAEAMRAAYAVSDNSHTAVRSLRNRLLLFGLLMLGLNIGLGVLSSLSPNLLPLCVKNFCAAGGTSSTAADVWLVQLLGALGGAVAVVILLLRTRPSVVAYTLTPYQACIKVMLGAVLAIAGILIAATGVLEGIVSTRPALLVLALILGYSQQVGTRFLDSYADTVVGKAQPKASDG